MTESSRPDHTRKNRQRERRENLVTGNESFIIQTFCAFNARRLEWIDAACSQRTTVSQNEMRTEKWQMGQAMRGVQCS